jgi:hypothetical protein
MKYSWVLFGFSGAKSRAIRKYREYTKEALKERGFVNRCVKSIQAAILSISFRLVTRSPLTNCSPA